MRLSDSVRSIVIVALLVIVSGCAEFDSFRNQYLDSPDVEAKRDSEQKNPVKLSQYKTWQNIPFIYRLQVGDKISVQHPHAQELNQQVTILPDGRIYLPLVGGLVAEDLSPNDLSKLLVKTYAADLRSPVVTVIPTKIGSQKVYVGGEVKQPGVYSYNGPFGVVEAIFSAGGLKNSANGEEVVILRRTPDNRAMMRTINIETLLAGQTNEQNIRIRQYDVVFVPRTTAAEIGVWVEQNITNIVPFSSSFSYTIQRNLK